MTRRNVLVAVIVGSLGLPVQAAAPKKGDKGDTARDAVTKVLRHEMFATVDRRAELEQTLVKHPDSNRARWQAGYVHDGDTWRPAEQPGKSTAEDERLRQYRERREAASNSFEGQLDLANWCRTNKLPDQERAHLRAAMDLSPDADHTAILERLGYAQFGNQWLSREQVQQWQALNRRTAAALKHWGPRLEKLADRLDGSQRQHESAVSSLRQLTDPDVIPVMECILCGRDESCAAATVEAFAKMEGYEATLALAKQAVFSKWPAVRDQAAKPLKAKRFEDFVPGLIGLVATPIAKRFLPLHWYYFDRPPDADGRIGQFVLVSGYILAQETDDQFQVAVMHQLDYRLTEALQGYFVRFRGGFHLEPEQNAPRNLQAQTKELTRARTTNDNNRNTAAETYARERLVESTVEALNERTDDLNRRVINVLAGVTGRDPSPDPPTWWQWWADFTDTQQVGAKRVVTVSEDVEELGDPTLRIRRRSCFAAGTPVWTETGQVPIESIKIGDRVLAQDVESGELTYKPVVCTTIRPRRELVRLRIGDDVISATSGHRFWVSGEGWIKARDLAPQSLVHTVTGNAPVALVEKGAAEETYNLVVADLHDYFVGRAGFLVQDLPLPQPTNTIVPGLTRRQHDAAGK
jgi:hypothetical protein